MVPVPNSVKWGKNKASGMLVNKKNLALQMQRQGGSEQGAYKFPLFKYMPWLILNYQYKATSLVIAKFGEKI